MLKIKEKFQKIIELSKDLIHKFPVTLLIVAFTTLFITVCIDTNLDDGFLQMMIIFLVSFFAGSFFIESTFKESKWKTIYFPIAGLISIFFGWYLNSFTSLPEFWKLFYIGYILVLMLMGIYSILKRSKLSFQEYITKVFSNMFFVSIIYGILAIGISLICWIFIELILDNDYDELLLRANLLLFGLYYVTGCIYAVTNVEKQEINVFIKNLIKFVLTPLVGIAMAIIYIYILKIFITGDVPSNVIFRICAILFCFAFPIWNMVEVVRNKENKIPKIFSYAYIPLLLLEVYSLTLRIISYGITPIRYVGIFFIVFQVIALILNFFWNKEKLPKIIVCGSILIALLMMTPLTPSKVSAMDQLARLTKYLPEGVKFTELEKDIQEKVAGAYKYMRYDDDAYEIPVYIKNQEEDIIGYRDYYDYRNAKDYYFTADERIKISGYDYATKFYSSHYSSENYFELYVDGETIRVNENVINDYVLKLIKKSENNKTFSYLDIDDPYLNLNDFTIYFTSINAYYTEDTGEVQVKFIEGFVLE